MPTCTVNNKFKVPQNSNYCGKYEFERRCDYKHENWEKDQVYEGEFFNDTIHGQGIYTWNNSGIYEGHFYSSCKEGYGILSLPNNSFFEGLFIKNQPFGPGILSHGNGHQDAGFWVGRKLVRLSRSVNFIVPRLAPTSAAKKKLKQFQRPIILNEKQFDSTTEIMKKCVYLFEYIRTPYSRLIYDSRSFFFDKLLFENTYFKNVNDLLSNLKGRSNEPENNFRQSEEQYDSETQEDPINLNRLPPSHCLCPDEVFLMDYKKEDVEDICEEKIILKEEKMGLLRSYNKRDELKGVADEVINKKLADTKQNTIIEESSTVYKEKGNVKEKPFSAKILSWNRSELCTEMLKQIFRFRSFEENLSFNIEKLMLGAQTSFRMTGEKERQCLQFLEICSLGPPYLVKEFLCSNEISEELMDARGNNSLMFAASTDQHDIIDLLLDYGVDVNTFNDESLTPLNLCLLRRLAKTHKISTWETAFLPTEGDDFNINEKESDQSLDHIVEDRISTNEIKNFLSEDASAAKKRDKNNWKKPSVFTDANKDLSVLSQITILNLKELQGDIHIKKSSLEVSNKDLILKLQSNDTSKFYKKDESEHRISTDRYLFELTPTASPTSRDNRKQKETFKFRKKNNSTDSLKSEQEESNMGLTEKIREIDKTIEKLLQRGADPNVSEVPKPSIHLGVFTKDLKIVYTLLVYGASPDCQLRYNEGLLTPLHVVALLKPAQEYVDICGMLLNFGANPEEETSPEFSTHEGEKSLLDSSRGRTPLHLLCMRPDLEYEHPERFLIKIGLLLAKASDKKNFYNGHSYLTLAMLSGNINLLRALLESKYFDPNVILGKDLGTALHVLVSTSLQMRTEYDKSLKMCDLLIAAGANPLKKFVAPEHLMGTCIDYGYREIEKERMNRKNNGDENIKTTNSKWKKNDDRDHLKDHVRVIEYLNKSVVDMIGLKTSRRASENIKSKTFKLNKYKDSDIKAQEKKGVYQNKEEVFVNKMLALPDETSEETPNSEEIPKKGKKIKLTEHSLKKQRENEKNGKREKHLKPINDDEKNGKREKHLKPLNDDEKNGKREKHLKLLNDDEKNGKREKHLKPLNDEKNRKREKHLKPLNDNEKNLKNLKKTRGLNQSAKEKLLKEVEGRSFFNKQRKNELKKQTPNKRDKKAIHLNLIGELKERRNLKIEYSDKEKRKRKSFIKTENGGISISKEKGKGKKELYQEIKKSNEKLRKPILTKHLTNMLPGKLQKYFLQMFDNCINFDINELLLPYVVLRDGDLYYRFQGKATEQKEQYSLI